MKLRTQKTIAKAFGGIAVAGAVIYGGAGLLSGDGAEQVATDHVRNAPVTRPESVTQQEPYRPAAVKTGDTAEEKAQKLAALQAQDLPFLAQSGFAVERYVGAGTCADNGTLADTRWRGVATGLSYEVSKDGRMHAACVTHRGGRPDALTTNYAARAQTPAPSVPPAVVTNAADEPFTKGTSDAARDQKLADMRAEDTAVLSRNGMTLVRRLNVGEACAADGSIAGDTKWKGTASSIQYEARMDGDRLQVCLNHKGGKPAGQVTGSAYKFGG